LLLLLLLLLQLLLLLLLMPAAGPACLTARQLISLAAELIILKYARVCRQDGRPVSICGSLIVRGYVVGLGEHVVLPAICFKCIPQNGPARQPATSKNDIEYYVVLIPCHCRGQLVSGGGAQVGLICALGGGLSACATPTPTARQYCSNASLVSAAEDMHRHGRYELCCSRITIRRAKTLGGATDMGDTPVLHRHGRYELYCCDIGGMEN
jgi:hypothetical protein